MSNEGKYYLRGAEITRKFKSFDELLAQGRYNFNVALEEGENGDLTGLESPTINSVYFEQLKDLNNYMYTTYSTNVNGYEKVLSVEGVIPLNVFRQIEPSLRRRGYWYIAVNPLTKELYGKNLIDPEEFDPTMSYTTITAWLSEDGANHLSSPPWENACSNGDHNLYINNFYEMHFLPPDSESLDLDLVSDETLDYTEHYLYQGSNPLLSIIIEDPVVGRISLYKKLYEYLSSAY